MKFREYLESKMKSPEDLKWFKDITSEMTTSGSAGGGGTFTNSIAGFARPLGSGEDEDKKKTHMIRRMRKEKW
jgi:hypothetical protein